MFSLCPYFSKQEECQAEQQQFYHIHNVTGAKQIKGGYLLRHKKHILWSHTWSEEWVVLYDDSTMAWFTEFGKSSPNGKILVKEAPEMFAASQWTGQIPNRPNLPEGCSVKQLIALGSRRKRSKVYWMLAQSEQEVSEWTAAIMKTLPPPPQIELILEKPLLGVLRRPIVRIRASSNIEVLTRRNEEKYIPNTSRIRSKTPVAIIKKNIGADATNRGTLACTIPWGYGYGWCTLPNGLWNGALAWSQCDEAVLLHALPSLDCTNVADTCEIYNPIGHGAHYADSHHHDSNAYAVDTATTATSSGAIEDVAAAEDYDYAVDCGDFIF